MEESSPVIRQGFSLEIYMIHRWPTTTLSWSRVETLSSCRRHFTSEASKIVLLTEATPQRSG
jgi:hypothetical protein